MSYQHYQCDLDWVAGHSFTQGRGVTTWNINNGYTIEPIPAGGTATLTFTCTVPKCYSIYNTISGCDDTNVHGKDACNLVFNAWANSNTTSEVKLQYNLNDTDVSPSYLSGVAGHGATQAFELANTGCTLYNDIGENTFKIINNSDVTVNIDHFKVYRIYKMCNLIADGGGYCTIGSDVCSPETTAGTNGNLDFTRLDTPCNFDSCGGLSYTHYQDTSHASQTLYIGNTFSWQFDFTNYSGLNYQQASICLFNFNQMWPSSTITGDMEMVVKVNNQYFTNFYLGRFGGKGLFPSFDLTASQYYNDNGANTVSIVNCSSTNVVMSDTDGIDIYRISQTESVCPPCQNCYVQCQGCNTCYSGQGCGVCNACYVGCEICQPCEDCQACQESCQAACYITCQPSCYMCQTACELGCLSCQSCYGTCEFCNATCEECMVTCQGCEPGYY